MTVQISPCRGCSQELQEKDAVIPGHARSCVDSCLDLAVYQKALNLYETAGPPPKGTCALCRRESPSPVCQNCLNAVSQKVAARLALPPPKQTHFGPKPNPAGRKRRNKYKWELFKKKRSNAFCLFCGEIILR